MWTKQPTDLLKRLWRAGKSQSEISREIQDVTGLPFTRRAVGNKARRLGLARRSGPQKRAQRANRRCGRFGYFSIARAEDLKAFQPETMLHTVPLEQRKTFQQPENHHCRWPFGTPGTKEFFFCGDPTANMIEGRPYCGAHHKSAFNPT